MEHVVVNDSTFILSQLLSLAVLYAEQVVPERWDHEELLHHAIHVADAAEIAQANIILTAAFSSLFRRRCVVPHTWLLDSVEHGDEHLSEEALHQSVTPPH